MADRKADLEIKGEKLPEIQKEMIEEDNNDSYSKSGCELNTEQIGIEQGNLNLMLDKNDDSDLKFDSKSGFEQTEYRFEQEKEVREEIVILDGDEEIERQQKYSMQQLLALYQQEDQQQIWQNFGYSINHITKTTQLEDHRAQIMQQHNIEKCFPDYNDIISVTIGIKNAKSLGLKVLNLMRICPIDFLNEHGLIIHSIDQAGPVALNGKIKGSRVNRGIAGVQYTSKLNEVGQKLWVQKIKYNNNLTKLPTSLIKGLDEN